MCLAVPGKILSVSEGEALKRTGKVSFGGIVKDVNLGLVPEAHEGDYVIVHVGVALSVLDEEEALKTLECLTELDDLVSAGGS